MASSPYALGGCGAPLRRAVLLLAAAALAVAATVAVGAGSSSSGDKVYFLNAMYSMNSYTSSQAQAIWLGMDAAFYHADYTAAGGRRVEIVEPSSSVDQSDMVAVVEAALAEYPSLLAVLGPYGDPSLVKVLASSTLMSSSLMFLAPFTGSSPVRTWNDNVYFMRAEPRAEVMAIVKYMANATRGRRNAFMYQTGINLGDAEYADFVSLMATVGQSNPALYSAPYSTTTTAVNTTAFDAMADTYPQVIVLWGVPGLQTENFLKAVLTDPRTSSAYIISSFMLQQQTFQVYYDLAMAGTITAVNDQVMSSGTSYPLTEPKTQHIPMFMAQMSKYMKNTGNVNPSLWTSEGNAVATYGLLSPASASGSSSYADAFLHEHPNVAQLMLMGWLAGTLIMQTVQQSNWIASRAAYQAALFQQHRYIVGGDFVLGDYGGECDPVAEFLGAVCSCNQGGHATVVSRLHNATWTIITGSGFNYTQNNCYTTSTTLARPLNFLTMLFKDHPPLESVGLDFNFIVPVLTTYLDYTTNPLPVLTVNVTEATAQTLVDYQVLNYTTDVITGTIMPGMDLQGYLVLAPMYPRPYLVELVEGYVYLMPTLEQQAYLLYQNLATVQGVSGIGSSVRFVMHGYTDAEVANITTVLQESAATFNYADPTVTSVSSSTTVASALASGRINFVLGVTVDDVSAIADFLAARTTAIVVVCFDDLTQQYGALMTALSSQPNSVRARLISFTNLPLWSDTSATAEAATAALQYFHAAVPDTTNHTPSQLRSVVMTLFMTEVLSTTQYVSTTALADTIYRNSVVSTSGLTFSTFTWGCTVTTSASVCVYDNYGAQSIVMLSAARMLDPTVPALTTASTPSMVYSARTTSGLTAAQRSGVIAGSVIGGVLLIAAVVLLVYCCSDSRDNDAAPKEGREPVTLIFTDIESSTAMWAALPQVMGDAIASHHRVIRQLIKKYGCYEVKTIGDSFMIACKDAYSAVQLVSEMQRKLLDYDWGTTEIDSKYREFELARVDTVEGYVPTTARLSEEEYAALWRGLRVRIGVHTGLSDIRYDEVTKGYDYYGDTSNMAARTEAIANGGQVVATETTWWALTNDQRLEAAHTAMGPQGLRGVPYAVEMYQLNPVAGRKHAALRTEIEAILPDDNATETASSAAGALLSSAGTMTGAAAGVAFVITSCFSPYPPVQRVRELQPLLAKWNIGAPPRNKRIAEEDYCKGLINRLAIRIASVTQARQAANAALAGVSRNQSDAGRGGVSNPLTGGGGSVAVSGVGRMASLNVTEVPPRAGERSAMQESRVLQRALSALRTQVSAVMTPANKESRSVSTVRWEDSVVPFDEEEPNAVSSDSRRVGGGPSVAGSGAGVRRRQGKPDA